ncbi:MAG: 2-iminoacetate synthase ThiH, partial [Verrucomicrobiales bacterium]|nr:2-iminoacetate synthase ThiH [Verrucomicrobiales bacterium]
MSFVEQFKRLEAGAPLSPRLSAFKHALDNNTPEATESLARRSAATTRKHFGRTMRLFAPLYLSNECVNNCQYCGFSRDN